MATTFDASAQTVTFTDLPSGELKLHRVMAVINATDQVVIYQPNNTGKGGTVATNVLTLEYDTTAMDDADSIMAVYDVPDNVSEYVNDIDTLVANTVTTQTLTASAFVPTEIEISNVTGAAVVYGTLDGTTPSATVFGFLLPATPSNVILPVNASTTVKVISAGTPIVASVLRGGS